MCPQTPNIPKVKTIIPQAPQPVEEPPKPVEVSKDSQTKNKRTRNPLRIDLAAGGGGSTSSSGVNV